MSRVGEDEDPQVVRVNTDKPLTADFVACFPDGTRDDSSFDDVESALDLAEVDCGGMGQPWLKLPERVALLAAERDTLAEQVRVLTEAAKTIRADALEEAAKVVETVDRDSGTWVGGTLRNVRKRFASAIRALSGSPS